VIDRATCRTDHDREVAVFRALWEAEQRHLEDFSRGEKEAWYLRKHLRDDAEIRRHLRSVDRMAPHVGGRVLEWGCRYAPDSVALRMRLGDQVELHGCDIRDGALFAPFFSFAGLTYKRLEHESALPYPDASFDTVIGHGVLEHVPQPRASISELARVLSDGGTLLIDALPNRYSWIEAYHRMTNGPAHDQRFSQREVRSLLSSAGFVIEEMRRVQVLPVMLNGVGPRAQRVYRAIEPLISRGSGVVPGPLSLIATSHFVVARRPDRAHS